MFKLVSKFSPTGDQPTAIAKLIDSLDNNNKYQTLLGVTGSGKTFTIANVIAKTNRPALIMAPNKTLAAQLYSEYKAFFPENAVEYFVSYYDYYQPEAYIASTDTYIEKDSSINDEIDKLRHAATAALLNRNDVIIVASVSAIYGLGAPEVYRKMSLPLEKGYAPPRKEILKKLISIRYERNDIEFSRGKFRVKGDTVDIYPVYMDTAYKLEFFGDELEEISEIDPLTGKKIKKNLERIMIMPATHYVTEEKKIEKILNQIREEMITQVEFFEKNGKLLEAQRIRQRTQYDLEMIREIGYCKGIENYSRYLAERKAGETPYTLLDYFSKDFIVFIDESHVGAPQIRGMYNGDRARKTVLVENGFRLPSAYDNRPLQFKEFLKKAKQLVFVSATPGDFEIENSKANIAEQLIRPTGIVEPEIEIRPTTNQVDDLMSEIYKIAKRKERVLVTTLTKKMAEELTEYYLEFGIKVKYMHSGIDTLERVDIIRGLRMGEFDVLVGINLLREGLDIPEVSLVAILEADKEGFLRSRRSLIQTMGRASRNINGRVILYADKETKSMKEALYEINRRKKKQKKYNIDNNIDPKQIIKELPKDALNYDYETIIGDKKILEVKKIYRNKTQMEAEIKKLGKDMKKYAEELNFEKAIQARDEMKKIKEILLEI
ncbi:excinuclease ABC subunit UvrB [Haliovirga abyssi]|uniref:UvrABC system protein B n=1 Tax=Haliovirga abyssi TaxID=2996794 RepID=A0AAU9DER2_9FUSO|nr:excinuclease ABC subunit UvrB [Haliovirga abyssi]BDU50678.1 UvrABC system protein B [Haliovirga abyssi]